MLYIGCHLSIEGGYLNMCKAAKSIGANTFQFFTKNPRGRSSGIFPSKEETDAVNSFLRENMMHPPLAHAPYTYNPASKDEDIRKYSAESMSSELHFLENIDGAMYNFHPGAHVGQGVETGIAYITEMLNKIMWDTMKTKVLLETMAGKGTEIGRNFEELAQIISGVDSEKRKNLGVCLDTCHVHDGGYDISMHPEAVLEEFDRVVGINKLFAVHLNDSKNEMGAAKDRHEKLGEGNISLDAFRYLMRSGSTKNLPFYLETPNELEGYRKEIELLRSFEEL